MTSALLRPELARLDIECESRQDLFERMSHEFGAAGFTAPSFGRALAEREARYPTALPTQPEAIAIPHADAVHIRVPFIAPIRLAQPVEWAEMGNDEVTHPVRIVFMLGLDKAEGQVAVLQALMTRLQDPSFFTALAAAPDLESFVETTQSIEGLPA